jgi:arginyl-tRNA synthetase
MKYETLIDELKAIIKKAICLNYNFRNEVALKPDFSPDIDRIKNDKFGDYCTKFLFHLQIPQESIKIYGNYLVKKLSKMKSIFTKIEFILPGFLNLTVTHKFLDKYLNEVVEKKNKYGMFKKSKLFYNLEFVSANPTGNLHLGHARNAAYGDSLVNI